MESKHAPHTDGQNEGGGLLPFRSFCRRTASEQLPGLRGHIPFLSFPDPWIARMPGARLSGPSDTLSSVRRRMFHEALYASSV